IDLIIPALAHQADRVDRGVDHRRQRWVVGGAAARPLGHPKRREAGGFERWALLEESRVSGIGARPAAFDVIDAQPVQGQRDLALVLDGEIHALSLSPVTQRGVKDVEAFAAHLRTSQVVPCGPSFSTIPFASSSSRMRSLSAKFLAARAALRASMASAMATSSTLAFAATFSCTLEKPIKPSPPASASGSA